MQVENKIDVLYQTIQFWLLRMVMGYKLFLLSFVIECQMVVLTNSPLEKGLKTANTAIDRRLQSSLLTRL